MDDPKRKQTHDSGARPLKRSKGGNLGAWQTPAHKSKLAMLTDRDAVLQVGDQGIWVTFARGMDRKAISELMSLCDQLGEKLYNIAPPREHCQSQDEEDIEASIEKELEGFKAGGPKRSNGLFKAIRADIDCVFFMKTREPVDPVSFCRKICEDAKCCSNLRERKTRYINRLTPVSILDKASENGVERVARKALAPWFDLQEETESDRAISSNPGDEERPAYSYAIRHSIRSNTELKHGELIQRIASLIGSRHRVSLENPDKVILVDVFKNFCGMSVVDGSEWVQLRKFNVNELYKVGSSGASRDTDQKNIGGEVPGPEVQLQEG
ncbi:hypothetical protein SODALDRAFT_326861 [Sodiomyces alkalinus F11]|uniref:THUMP domain-containing protein n=1 Tax=Sodiomyces alkalinus (strain CBS 110278 / VKM F-3762 / F11) TaxID=1314773 RepID=A0A3N2Q7F5_SODAK|nr:hypothetical protein SODALDRAFT_326861 [Sodiomyces alkalinus F11]ROT42709.1 hypothetical protein SODALDRAFT_326861 [Sodiomyces alkalinus F11]